MNWNLFFLSLALLCSSCATAPDIYVTPKLFVPDHSIKALVRKQGATTIQCDSPAFDEFVCMTTEDFEQFSQELISGRKY